MFRGCGARLAVGTIGLVSYLYASRGRAPFLRRHAGAERGSRVSQILLNSLCGRVHPSEHAPRDPYRVLERRHGLAKVVERGGGVFVERRRVNKSRPERSKSFESKRAALPEDKWPGRT